jgi:tRNA 2-thiouridine synthesizing protein A
MDRNDAFEDEAEVDLDLRGLKCPLPVLRIERALRALKAGQRLRAIATDPLAGLDIRNLVQRRGDELLRLSTISGVTVALIRRVSPSE